MMMLVRLSTHVTPARRQEILAECAALGLFPAVGPEAGAGVKGNTLRLIGEPSPGHRSKLEDIHGIVAILEAGDARELHERAPGAPDTSVRVHGPAPGGVGIEAAFGAGDVSVIAGPCAAEDPESLLEIARAVRAAGATLLRGGAFKPRTSPYSFQGVGKRALEWLAAAREATGLGLVTEVLDPRDVEAVGEVCDVFQIGARSMTNAALLVEVGRFGKPVLLKRGIAATIREFLLAAEFVLAQGNEQVILCERGVRGFDQVTRNLLDVGGIAHLKRVSHLPVVADPSHAAGRSELVRPLARAGLAAGADGLIIEVHPRPDEAHSDARQAISPGELSRIVDDARILAGLDGRRLVLPGGPAERDPRPSRPVESIV